MGHAGPDRLVRLPLPMTSYKHFARGLATAFVAGPWSADELLARGRKAVGGRAGRWLRPLVHRLFAELGAEVRPSLPRVLACLLADARLQAAFDKHQPDLSLIARLPAVMAPAPGAAGQWRVPEITTPSELAELLGVSLHQLDWFSHPQVRRRRAARGPLCHYRYRWVTKWSGSARLIEAPKPRLRDMQRRLLDEVLAAIPTHEAAHGYRAGCSIRSFVAPHVGREIVLRIDLRNFFPSISGARIRAIFRTAGYPDEVAGLLAGLCTNVAPAQVWSEPSAPASWQEILRLRKLYEQPHLPQGAPTSPALANLCAFRLDCRLAGLAAAAGANYTRYADDLVFSGGPDFARGIGRFQVHVAATALEEGFAVAFRKTRVMRRGVRQAVAGLVLNERISITRHDYDALKATLYNCTRGDPLQQNLTGHPNFRAHLAGRIAYLHSIDPVRGQRLQALFQKIVWPAQARPKTEPGQA